MHRWPPQAPEAGIPCFPGLGGKPDDGGSARGRGAPRLGGREGHLTDYSDCAILEETERGEDAALARYRTALEEELPADVRTVLDRRYEGVKRNPMTIRRLRDAARAAG